MSRRNWYFAATVVGYLAGAAILWAALRPNWPIIPGSEYQKAEQSEYDPGSPRCLPSRLGGLDGPEAADERYRCELAAEARRLAGEELVQQTRSAEADIAMVDLAYRQTLISLAAVLSSLLTLVAAFYAAWYARRAAEETSRSAKAAEDTLSHSRDLAELHLRAYMAPDLPTLERWPADDHGTDLGYRARVNFKNYGSTPAKALRYRHIVFKYPEPPTFDELHDQTWEEVGLVAQNDSFYFRHRITVERDELAEIAKGEMTVYLLCQYSYEDVFHKVYRERVTLKASPEMEWTTCTVEPEQPEQPELPGKVRS